MYRKTGSFIDFNNAQPTNHTYCSYGTKTGPQPLFNTIIQPSFRVKEEPLLSSPDFQYIKMHKKHTRNYSDVSNSCANKVEMVDNKQNNPIPNRVKLIQQRLTRIEQSIKLIQTKIQTLPSKEDYNKLFLQQKALITFKHENQIVLNEMSFNLKNFKQQLQNLYECNSRNEGISNQVHLLYENKEFLQKIKQSSQAIVESAQKDLKAQINQLKQKFKVFMSQKTYIQSHNMQVQFFKTNRKYSGNAISFAYEQFIRRIDQDKTQNIEDQSQKDKQNNKSSQKICLNQIIYYIDIQGFLLDEKSNYLVNSQMKQIKLTQKQLRMLRKQKILLI